MRALEISNGIEITNPTNDEIRKHLHSCLEKEYEFIILNRDESSFIQMSPTKDDKFVIEYRLGSNDKHYTSKEAVNIDNVVDAFEGFAMKTANWRSGIDWEKLDAKEPVKTYKKLNLIGYFPLFIFLVMSIATAKFEVDYNYWTNKILLTQWEFLFLCLNIGLLLQYPYSIYTLKNGNAILDNHEKLLRAINIFGTPILTIGMLIHFVKLAL